MSTRLRHLAIDADLPNESTPQLRGVIRSVRPAVGFLGLPGEVRNRIYRFALTAKYQKPSKCVWSGNERSYEGKTYSFATQLLRVNKQIYHEASSIFHGENGFVLIREAQLVHVLNFILQQGLPAIALTRRASRRIGVAMIFQFEGYRKDSTAEDFVTQIVIAAQDFETFALIAFEMKWLGRTTMGDMSYVQFPASSNHALTVFRTSLLETLGLLGYTNTALMIALPSRKYAYQPEPFSLWTYRRNVELFFSILLKRADLQMAERKYSSAAFHFGKAVDNLVRVRERNYNMSTSVWSCQERLLSRMRHQQAVALRRAGRLREAHEAVKAAISTWESHDLPDLSPKEKSRMCRLRAQLDESHGGPQKLVNAVFWLRKALRYDAENQSLKTDVRRVEKRIRASKLPERNEGKSIGHPGISSVWGRPPGTG